MQRCVRLKRCDGMCLEERHKRVRKDMRDDKAERVGTNEIN